MNPKIFIILIAMVIQNNAIAQNLEEIQKEARKQTGYALELCKHLHQNPELSFHEFETAKRMAAELKEAGFEVTEKVGGNNVVGVLRNGDGPVVMLRTDMDALPVQEKTGLEFASNKTFKDRNGEEVPVMHACGHDIHMSVLTGTIRTLALAGNTGSYCPASRGTEWWRRLSH